MKLNNLRLMLDTADIKETIRFYTDLLGFSATSFYPDEENACWVSLAKDDSEIMFSLRNEHSKFTSPVLSGAIYFNVDDVDDVWENLKDKGQIEYPIENFDFGMREFAIRDCNGYLLQFGQEI